VTTSWRELAKASARKHQRNFAKASISLNREPNKLENEMNPYFCCVVIIAFEKGGAYPFCQIGESPDDALGRVFTELQAREVYVKELILSNCQDLNDDDLNNLVHHCLGIGDVRHNLNILNTIKGMRITETYIYQPN
jgi:hypothetical protein